MEVSCRHFSNCFLPSHMHIVLISSIDMGFPFVSREKDPDPDGKQLAATADPLGEATKLVQQLRSSAGDRLKTHLLAFEVCFCSS